MLRYTLDYGGVKVYKPEPILATKLPKLGLALATDIGASIKMRVEGAKTLADAGVIFYYLDYDPRLVAKILYDTKLIDSLNYIIYNFQGLTIKLAETIAKYLLPMTPEEIEQFLFDHILKIKQYAEDYLNADKKQD